MMAKNSPVKLLYGREEFLKREWIDRQIRSLFPQGSSKDLNYSSLSCQKKNKASFDIREIVDLARTAPFLADRRLIVLSGLESLHAKEQSVLLSYCEEPLPTTLLILETSEGTLKRSSFLKQLAKHVEAFAFYELGERELVQWIKMRARSFKKEIDEEAVQVVRERVGSRLVDLVGVLDELSLYVGEKKVITAQEAQNLLGFTAPSNAFELADSILKRDAKRALTFMHKLMMEGVKAPEMIGALFWQLGRLMQVRTCVDRGASPSDLSRLFRMSFQMSQSIASMARQIEITSVRHLIDCLAQTDEAIKTGLLSGEVAMERLVCEYCASTEKVS